MPQHARALHLQVFVNLEFLTDFCRVYVPAHATPAQAAALLSAFLRALSDGTCSPHVAAEASRELVVPVLEKAVERGVIQEVLGPELVDALFETLSAQQAPAKLQRLLTNVRAGRRGPRCVQTGYVVSSISRPPAGRA